MNQIRKAKTIRKLQADLAIQEALYDKLSKELILIKSNSHEWDDFVEKYNQCAYRIGFISKQIEIVERTGKTLGKAQDDGYQIYGRHFCDHGTAL